KFNTTFADIADKNKLEFLHLDIGENASIQSSAGEYGKRYKSLDILVNNAIASPHMSGKSEQRDQFTLGLEGCLSAVQNVTMEFIPYLEANKNSGIINI